MCVCVPSDGGHTPGEVAAHRDLLARRLGVHVDDDHARSLGRRVDQRPDRLERAVGRFEEAEAEQVDHCHVGAVPRRDDAPATPGGAREQVGRPHDPGLALEVLLDPAPGERVVAERDCVRPGGEQGVGETRGDASPVGDVLAVHDDEIELELSAHAWNETLHRLAAWTPDDVRDEEDPHAYGDRPGAGSTESSALSPPSEV